MPQCPKCKAYYEVGQRYCEQCDSYLLHPEEGDYFCPQCGVRVASLQEICHKCNANLIGITAASPPDSEAPSATPSEPLPSAAPQNPSFPRGPGLPPWALGALIGACILIVVLLVLLLRQGAAPTKVAEPPPTPAVTPTVPATPKVPAAEKAVAPEATAPTPKASLADQVKETLRDLREAQLKNDIILFMSCYSYLYPSLDKKRKQTLSYWKDFKYMDLDFILDDVKPIGPESAMARVTWTMQIQDRDSQRFDSSTQVFKVVLGKELGKWRIRSIKDIVDEENEEE